MLLTLRECKMNRRSYLKGVGIGIIVTALILIISQKFNTKTMSDEDVIKRAKELGMTESVTLSDTSGITGETNDSKDITNENDSKISDEDKNNSTEVEESSFDNEPKDDVIIDNDTSAETNESNDNDSLSDDSKDKAENKNDTSIENDKKSDSTVDSDDNSKDSYVSEGNTNPSENVDTVCVVVKSGQGSETISASVKEAGLIEDAVDFNKYLCQNGYDKTLRVGTHEIPKDADYETIARKLCGL